uniref:Uncharacterized protein n=1 Tax=Oryza sativa subsp. japonica TaxID=39947 RepID=Q8S633_ORYSJ|nr:hypothetical protein [Oryza sativa Japonica Group]
MGDRPENSSWVHTSEDKVCLKYLCWFVRAMCWFVRAIYEPMKAARYGFQRHPSSLIPQKKGRQQEKSSHHEGQLPTSNPSLFKELSLEHPLPAASIPALLPLARWVAAVQLVVLSVAALPDPGNKVPLNCFHGEPSRRTDVREQLLLASDHQTPICRRCCPSSRKIVRSLKLTWVVPIWAVLVSRMKLLMPYRTILSPLPSSRRFFTRSSRHFRV